MNKSPILQIENLSKSNNKDIIFKKVSFNINKHDFVSLKGPSGCGKTTFLRIISGLAEPTEGKIFIEGRLANAPKILIPPHQRKMNLLFQDLALWPHMTGYEQLKFVWESSKKETLGSGIDKVCSDIGLSQKLLTKYPSQISRGEQQRLAIARTLINQPEILLLDEPLTALDQQLREQFMTFLQNIKKERTMTVIIVSHDLMTNMIEYDLELIYQDNSFRETKKS